MGIDTSVTDGCSKIPDVIFGINIRSCCVDHDTVKACCVSTFYRCLKWKLRRLRFSVALSFLIATGGELGCWWQYPKFMWRKLWK